MANFSQEIVDVANVDAGTEAAPMQIVAFIKIPNDYAGKLLGKGKPGAQALRLLAIKLHHGGEAFTLNAKFAAKNYEIGKREFGIGIGLLAETGILDRSSNGGRAAGETRSEPGKPSFKKRFAAEELKRPTSKHFVAIPVSDLRRKPTELAFRVAVLLSPEPSTPAAAGARAGVTSHVTVDKIVDGLRGEIAIYEAPGKATLLARPGYTFDNLNRGVVSFDPVKNDPVKNVPTQVRRKDSKKQEEIILSHATPSPSGAAAGGDVEWATLSDWYASVVGRIEINNPWFPSIASIRTNAREEIMPPAEWRKLLDHFGGAPEHISGSNGFRQANEIAHALMAAVDNSNPAITRKEAMIGLAYVISKAVKGGSRIRSLGFIVLRLARAISNDDWAWARDWPDRLGHLSEELTKFVEQLIEQLRVKGAGHCPTRLRSAFQRERLFDLIKTYEFDAVESAFAGPALPEILNCHRMYGWYAYEGLINKQSKKLKGGRNGR